MISDNRKPKKQHRYVTAYEKIEEMIRSSSLSPGDKLPSESELAQQLNVSRGTLRQALSLLKEDGVIYNHQGKGSFLRCIIDKDDTGIEKVHNNPLKFVAATIEQTKLFMEYLPSSKKVMENLEMDEAALLAQFHVTYYVGEECVAYRLYFIPYEYLWESKVDLNDDEVLLDYISKYIDEHVVQSKMSFSCVEARQSVADRMGIPTGMPLLYFDERMRFSNGKVAVYAKAYYNPNYFSFHINRG